MSRNASPTSGADTSTPTGRPTLTHSIMVDDQVYKILREKKLDRFFERGWDRVPTYNDAIRDLLKL